MSRPVSPDLQQLYNQFPADKVVRQRLCKISYFAIGIIIIVAAMILSRVYGPRLGNYSWLVFAAGYAVGFPLIVYGSYECIHPLKGLLKRDGSNEERAVKDVAPRYLGKRYDLKEEFNSLSVFDPRRDVVAAAIEEHTAQMVQRAHVMKGFMWKLTTANGATVHLVASCQYAIEVNPSAAEAPAPDLVHAKIKAVMESASTVYVERNWVAAYESQIAENQDEDESAPSVKPPVVPSHLRQLFEVAKNAGKTLESIFGVLNPDDLDRNNPILQALGKFVSEAQQFDRENLNRYWDRATILEVLDALQSGNLETLEKIAKRDDRLFGIPKEIRSEVACQFAASIATQLNKGNNASVVALNALECIEILELLKQAKEPPENCFASDLLAKTLAATGAITVERVPLD